MSRIHCTILTLVITTMSIAQGENNIWYFGQNAGLDHNSGNPVPLLDGQINTDEGCAVLSNANGELLFYTDGVSVWDRQHNMMPNGFGLDGGTSSTQSALIVPAGNSGIHYIFTVEEITTSPNRLSYSIVDLSLNGGFGDVTEKNILLMPQATEQLAGIWKSDGTGIWVMGHTFSGNQFHAYLVTDSGLQPSSIISSVGQPFTAYDGVGQFKFSTDGSQLAIAAWGTHFVELFDFETATGIVSNARHINMPVSFNSVYGLEFSPSGQRLYAANVDPGQVFQWDISSGNAAVINASGITLSQGIGSSRGQFQLGPDGKIYIANQNQSFLSMINSPDALGAACDLVENGVSLGGRISTFGLPNLIHLPSHIPTTVDAPAGSQLEIHPTAFTDLIHVSFNDEAIGVIQMTIRDLRGAQVFQKRISDVSGTSTTLDLGHLSQGVYLLEVLQNGSTSSRKLMKYN